MVDGKYKAYHAPTYSLLFNRVLNALHESKAFLPAEPLFYEIPVDSLLQFGCKALLEAGFTFLSTMLLNANL